MKKDKDYEIIRDFGDKVLDIAGGGMQPDHVEGALLAAVAMAMALNISPAEFVSKAMDVLHAAMES